MTTRTDPSASSVGHYQMSERWQGDYFQMVCSCGYRVVGTEEQGTRREFSAHVFKSAADLPSSPDSEKAADAALPSWAVELLPCPFCGGKAEITPYKHDGLSIGCACGFKRNQRQMRLGLDWLRGALIESWNKRAHPTPAPVPASTPSDKAVEAACDLCGGSGSVERADNQWDACPSCANGTEILPCPFCGGQAERIDIEEGENAGGSCVACKSCGASSAVEFEFKENFISKWNARIAAYAIDRTKSTKEVPNAG